MLITSKGQVTIPQELREALGFLPHTDVQFEIEGKRLVLSKTKKSKKTAGKKLSRGERMISSMIGKGTVKLTTDEIMAMTRGE